MGKVAFSFTRKSISLRSHGGDVFTAVWPIGVAWLWRGVSYTLFSPKKRPYFSERNGLLHVVWSFRGWRLLADPVRHFRHRRSAEIIPFPEARNE